MSFNKANEKIRYNSEICIVVFLCNKKSDNLEPVNDIHEIS